MDEYRCWHACLERSDRSKWSKEVERDFTDAHGLPFDEWWEKTKENFEKLPRDTLYVLESAEDFDGTSSHGLLHEIVVLINLETPKVELMAALQKLLNNHHKGKRGRPKPEQFSEWHVQGRPRTKAIFKALEVYDTAAKRSDLTLWQIGVVCNASLVHVAKKSTKKGTPKREDFSDEQRRVLASTVSRYLKRANELIAGVEKGVFPA
ncbi:hypothetical protein [Hydrogenophaga sp.]|uniref:hypothetical protein n=1 Tax=Hydrogenophaga sp. TaxID=1904254 RepID=UPI002FC97917